MMEIQENFLLGLAVKRLWSVVLFVKSAARVTDEVTAVVGLSCPPVFLRMEMVEIFVPQVV